MAQILGCHLKEIFFDLVKENFLSVLFSLLIIYAFYMSLWLLTKRAFVGALLTGVPLYILGAAQYYKFAAIGENVFPWDAAFLPNLLNFADFYTDIKLTFYIVFFFIALLLYTFFLALFSGKLKIKLIYQILLPVLILVSLYVFLVNPYVRSTVYEKLFSLSQSEMFDQEMNYKKNGLVSAFLLNLGSMGAKIPDNYSEAEIDNILKNYVKSETGADFASPDVILILSEALWDPTVLDGCTFSRYPLENYRQIRSKSYGGSMISNTFGGATVRPEIEVLTGLTVSYFPSGVQPYQHHFQKPTWSYASYFKNLGYDTVALHTYYKSFFNRDSAFYNLGFDIFKDVDSLETQKEYSSVFVSDDTFMNEIIFELEKQRDSSLFLFGITMGNHGLYGGKYKDSDIAVRVKSEYMTDEDIMILENLSQGLYEFDMSLKKLYDYVNSREKETIVIVFGDHLPSLGADYRTYILGGLLSSKNSSQWRYQEKFTMTRVPYLVFANYDIENQFDLDGEDISPSFLMSNILSYMGAPQNALIDFLNDFKNYSPVYNRAFQLYSCGADDEKGLIYTNYQWALSYDLTLGRLYALKYLLE